MASYGFLGALGGASKSVSDGMLMKMEEAKEGRLAELRGGIDRENRSVELEQRHGNALALQEQKQTNTAASDATRHEQSLAELKQRDEYDTAGKQFDIDSEPTFTQKQDASGKLTGQVNDRTNEWSRAGDTSGVRGGSAPSDAQMIDYLVGHGMKREYATEKVMSRSGTGRDDFRRQLMLKMIGSTDDFGERLSSEEMSSRLDSSMGMAYPDASKSGVPQSYDDAVQMLKGKYQDWDDAKIDRYIAAKLPDLKK